MIRTLYVCLGVGETALMLLLPRWVFGALREKDFRTAVLFVGVVVAFRLVKALIMRITHVALYNTEARVFLELDDAHLRKMAAVPLLETGRNNFFDRYSLALKKNQEIYGQIIITVFYLLQAILMIAVTGMVLSDSGPVVIGLLAFFLLLNGVLRFLGNKAKLAYDKKFLSQERKYDYLVNLFLLPSFMRDLKLSRFRNLLFGRKNEQIDHLITTMRVDGTKSRNYNYSTDFTEPLEYGLMTIFFAWRVFVRGMKVENFFVAVNAYHQFRDALSDLIAQFDALQMQDLYYQEILRLYADYPADDRPPLTSLQSVTFENVTFSYPGATKPVFKNLSLTISRGEKTLIQGDNGQGKTTLLYLLLGIYRPSGGRIYYNGDPSLTSERVSAEPLIGALFQNAPLYPFTLAENITLSPEPIDRERLKGLHDQLGLHWSPEDQLNASVTTQFSDEGIDLSGGQAQALGLLRTLYGGQDWTAFDEPSNNLDALTRERVYHALARLDKTVIVIAHDAPNEEEFSRVLNLEELQN